MPKVSFPLSELRPFATPREIAALDALEASDLNGVTAAAALGISRSALNERLRTCRRRMVSGRVPGDMPGFYAKQITTNRDGEVTATQWRPEESPQAELPPSHVIKGISQLVDGEGREILRWTKTNQAERDRWDAFKAATKTHAAEYRGLAGTSAPVMRPLDTDLLSVYAIGDAHCGMYAWAAETGRNFDLKIWQTQLQSALDLLISQSPEADRCVIFNAGDWFHVQSSDFRTPASGHKLDADSRLGKIVRVGVDCMRWVIDRALQKHRHVCVRNTRGNHDTDLSTVFNAWLQSVYENEPRVSIPDNYAFRHYDLFGKNLLGYTHGDGSKLDQLPGLMAVEQREEWGRTDHHFWLTGHVHHKRTLKRQEYPGVIVESFSTMAPKDAWHAWKGYTSEQGVESLLLHRELGMKARGYVSLAEVTSAIQRQG